MDVSQQRQLTELYIDHCRYEKRLDEKTIKAYKIDIQQFWGYLKEENGECSKEFLHSYIAPEQEMRPKLGRISSLYL